MKTVTLDKYVKPELKTPKLKPTVKDVEIEKVKPERSKSSGKLIIRLALLSVIALIGLLILWLYLRPTKVEIVQPKQVAITETITSSGRVGGVTETNVGSQSQGIVETLFVAEGAEVVRGQQLALIKSDVAQAQISQAQASVNTAQSQLELASRGALPSDIDASTEQVRQTQAVVEQQNSAIIQSQKNVLQARSLLSQFEAERDLAKKELGRSNSLVKAGVISRSENDQAQTTFRVADKKVAAQNQAIALAQSGVKSAQAGLKSAQANVRTQQARLRTVQSGARPEDISVAEQRVSEAGKALSVAQEQAANANVTAPFSGIVTKINSEVGQTVGSIGVLTLVSIFLEIRSVIGADPVLQDLVTPITPDLIAGKYQGLGSDEIVIENQLATDLDVSVGDQIRLNSSVGISESLNVAGIYSSGQGRGSAYVTLRNGQSFFGYGSSVNAIYVKVYDIYNVDNLANTIMALVPYEARPWTADFGSFLTNMNVMGASAYLISAFSLIASAFSIAAVLIVSVLQKSQQIGILKSMGAKQSQILRIFVFEGLGVAIFGSFLGAVIGTLVVFLLGLLTRASTQIGKPPDQLFPVKILPTYIALAVIAAIITTVIASVLPARRAAKLNPVDVMR